MFSTSKRGFFLALVLVICAVIITLAVSLNYLASQNKSLVTHTLHSQIAFINAKCGVEVAKKNFDEIIETLNSGTSTKFKDILISESSIPDQSILGLVDNKIQEDLDLLNDDLEGAKISVDIRLEGFKFTEIDPKIWADPYAKEGWLVVRSTGTHRKATRTLVISQKVTISSILPAHFSKFTLMVDHVDTAKINCIQNDYMFDYSCNSILPITAYNHPSPEFSLFQPGETASTRDLFKDRGWIYIGGNKVRFNICSGTGTWGEIFFFYNYNYPADYMPIKFNAEFSQLPSKLKIDSSRHLLRDDAVSKNILPPDDFEDYTFGYSFILDGFHYKSSQLATDAMYQNEILSSNEKDHYGSKTSLLHLYGDNRLEYRSFTKVLGDLNAAFPRYSVQEVIPHNVDLQDIFNNLIPNMIYMLPAKNSTNYNKDELIEDFFCRTEGGPVLPMHEIYTDYNEYSSYMSSILEFSFVDIYNLFVQHSYDHYFFPPKDKVLTLNDGKEFDLYRNGNLIYKNSCMNNNVIELLKNRATRSFTTINEFIDECYDDKTRTLNIGGCIRILNPKGIPLRFPPLGVTSKIKIKTGGLIFLENGNLNLKGIFKESKHECVTVIMEKGDRINLYSNENHINIIGRSATIYPTVQAFKIFGTVVVSNLDSSNISKGGSIHYPVYQNPEQNFYKEYIKVFVAPTEEIWYSE